MRWKLATAAVVVLLAASCGDDGGASPSGPLVGAADAEAVAQSIVPGVADLDGDGWSILSENDFGDESNSGEPDEFDMAFDNEEECQELGELSGLNLGGQDTTGDDIGRAQIEFERNSADFIVPMSLETEATIESDIDDIWEGWPEVQEVAESGQLSDCMIAVFESALVDGDDGIEFSAASRTPSATSTDDGIEFAFDLTASVEGFSFDIAFEFYAWPYGNIGMTAFVTGPPELVDAELTQPLIDGMQSRAVAAAG